MRVARICAMPIIGLAADFDAGILTAIAKYSLGLAWLAWAPADHVSAAEMWPSKSCLHKAFAVGAKAAHNIQKIKDAFGRARVMELSVVGCMSLS